MVPEAAWAEAVRLLSAAEEVDLVCHVGPDGDALGSALAAGLGLAARGTRVRVSFGDDPQVVPDSLGLLPGLELLVPAAAVPERPGVMAVFDCASASRLGLLRGKAAAARHLVVLDHHASNSADSGFGTVRLVDPAAAATAVLVERLLGLLGVPLDASIAACLYTGVASDTGSFKYAGTTPAVHELAGRLLATGIRHDLIARRLWDTASFGYLKVLAAALERARLDQAAAGGLGLVWTVVPQQELRRHGVAYEEVEGLIDQVRKVESAEVALVLKERPDGALYGSARAKGAVDLGPVCAAMGGGGHAFAAGFTSVEGPEATVERFRALLDAAGPREEPPAPGGGGAAVPHPRISDENTSTSERVATE
ncbi:DHH family phosphoesterase [Mangrovactinospora gilvigrisea]|uniref:DHH family phosphoesterase n=1 Tax=Mangrovactinospora gilvigrisea TaxID=1428644 RepID=A0A1J7C1D4_9ACTN|nr:DHHA1 domain-containing protein [Mangrovactinospora gilvigrisea]OIV35376.1 DHH family phosphoesterase [Mangrovactinospora gilvigrisea]